MSIWCLSTGFLRYQHLHGQFLTISRGIHSIHSILGFSGFSHAYRWRGSSLAFHPLNFSWFVPHIETYHKCHSNHLTPPDHAPTCSVTRCFDCAKVEVFQTRLRGTWGIFSLLLYIWAPAPQDEGPGPSGRCPCFSANLQGSAKR